MKRARPSCIGIAWSGRATLGGAREGRRQAAMIEAYIAIAESLDIEGVARTRKQDLIFQILRARAEKNAEERVLDALVGPGASPGVVTLPMNRSLSRGAR